MNERMAARPTSKIIIVLGLLLALGAGLWWLARKTHRDNGDSRRSTSAVSSIEQSVGARQPSASLPSGDFQEVRGDLEARALAGDAQAAYRLGQIMGRCLNYKPIPGGFFVEALARATAQFGGDMRILDRRLDDPDLLDTLLYNYEEIHALCGEIGDLTGSVRVGDARVWLEMAAERGHTVAMAEYGFFAFDDMPTDAELLENAATVARRREQARTYLRRALESGEPKALLGLASAHGHKPYLGRDMTEALAYLRAYRQTADGRKLPDGVFRLMESQLHELADPQQVRDSARRSAEILRAYRERRTAQ